MEKQNIIDRSGEQLMRMPSFTPYTYNPPSKMEPIVIRPLPLLRPGSNLKLSQQVLGRLGVREQGGSIMKWINCAACACDVIPREAIYEISEQDSDAQTSKQRGEAVPVEKVEKWHINDPQRRKQYEQEWRRIKKYAVKLPRVSFQQFFQEKGYLEGHQWSEAVGSLFK